jgi:hypothetical protein
MGIKISTVTTCTCDICTAECRQDDRRIIIDVKPAERDVGPSQITGSILYNEPYGSRDGYICKECKIRYLKQYIKELES